MITKEKNSKAYTMFHVIMLVIFTTNLLRENGVGIFVSLEEGVTAWVLRIMLIVSVIWTIVLLIMRLRRNLKGYTSDGEEK